jgi:hypothetical protein
MTTKRVPINRPTQPKITDEAVQLWKKIREIQSDGDDDFFEYEDGRRREFFDAEISLEKLLGISPWEITPSSAAHPAPPPHYEHERRAHYSRAHALFMALEDARRDEAKKLTNGHGRPNGGG